MALKFIHGNPYEATSISVDNDPAGGLKITVTLTSTDNDVAFVKMWYQQPSQTYFNSTVAKPLCPYNGNIAYSVQSTPAGTEPSPLPVTECITGNVNPKNGVPVTFSVSWMPPNPNETTAFFFQACPSQTPNALSNWIPTNNLNAQHC